MTRRSTWTFTIKPFNAFKITALKRQIKSMIIQYILRKKYLKILPVKYIETIKSYKKFTKAVKFCSKNFPK